MLAVNHLVKKFGSLAAVGQAIDMIDTHPAIKLLKKIPRGKVATYQELARVCKTSPRAIGRIMAHNNNPKEYPCYKVVAVNGALTGYSAPGGIAKKRKLLERDGITFSGDLANKKHFWRFSKRDFIRACTLAA